MFLVILEMNSLYWAKLMVAHVCVHTHTQTHTALRIGCVCRQFLMLCVQQTDRCDSKMQTSAVHPKSNSLEAGWCGCAMVAPAHSLFEFGNQLCVPPVAPLATVVNELLHPRLSSKHGILGNRLENILLLSCVYILKRLLVSLGVFLDRKWKQRLSAEARWFLSMTQRLTVIANAEWAQYMPESFPPMERPLQQQVSGH